MKIKKMTLANGRVALFMWIEESFLKSMSASLTERFLQTHPNLIFFVLDFHAFFIFNIIC